MITTINDAEALALTLGPATAKPGSSTLGQVEAGAYVLGDHQSSLRIGVWECSPGAFTVTRTTTEICRLVRGSATLRSSDGETKQLTLGETFVLEKGWSGEWIVHETVRKIFIVHAP